MRRNWCFLRCEEISGHVKAKGAIFAQHIFVSASLLENLPLPVGAFSSDFSS